MKPTNLILEPFYNIAEPHPNLDYSNKQKGPWFENTLSNPNLLKDPEEKIWAIHAEGKLERIFNYDYLSIVEGDMPSEYGIYAVKVNLGGIRGIVHLLSEPLNMNEIDDPKILKKLVRKTA